MRLDQYDLDILESSAADTDRKGTWRPWRGSYQRARNLMANGYLKEAGTCAMPPHVLYVITDFGRQQLADKNGDRT
mgnify:CR=1 FL=1